MKNIILVGFMGTGKSTVAQLLAKQLNRVLVETDTVIEKQMKKSVANIFAEYGERGFRKLERSVVITISHKKSLIISCGGGTILDKHNLNDLEKSGHLICLTASLASILKRLEGCKNRPLYSANAASFEKLYGERQKAYAFVKIQIDTDNCTPQQVVDKIIEIVKPSKNKDKNPLL